MIGTIQKKERPAEILLVEDNPGDIMLTQRAFREASFPSHIHVAVTAEMALAMLRREDEFKEMPQPDLVLLDLNLPRMDGNEALKIIKDDHRLKNIPVIVLSSSLRGYDVIRSYHLHANGYVCKPADLDAYRNMARSIENFFLQLAVFADPQDMP